MNIIKVKIVGSDGALKGRAYTYKSAIPVVVGDRVVADMAGLKKELEVVEIDVPQSEIDGLSYEIKLIDGLADTTEVADSPEIDIKMTVETMPVLKINFDEVKSALGVILKKYKGIAVSEQTLQGCKATQKELAGCRAKIDRYRKDKKKEYSAPIAEFESQCKDLIGMIEDVERPIKAGIAVYDDDRRNAKRTEAETLRTELLAESGLDEKYHPMLQIKDIYCNLTANKNTIKNDMLAEIQTLMEKQKSEQMKRESIIAAIDAQNGRLKKQLCIEDFKNLMDAELPTIIREIQLKADIIFEAENPKEPEPTEAEPIEPEPIALEPIETPAPIEPENPVMAVYKISLQGNKQDITDIINEAIEKGLDVEVVGEMML